MCILLYVKLFGVVVFPEIYAIGGGGGGQSAIGICAFLLYVTLIWCSGVA